MTAAQDIALFLASKIEPGKALRVSEIAAHPECPVRPTPWMTVGDEAHCHRVSRALERAFMDGVVQRTRPAGRGPWFYRAVTEQELDVAVLKEQCEALIGLVQAQQPFVTGYPGGGRVPSGQHGRVAAARARVIDAGVTL